MAHEELKKQYEEDCKNHNHPWSLWEFFYEPGGHWKQCICPSPDWHPGIKYRRKEPPFQPEYFSGLSWREAEKPKTITLCGSTKFRKEFEKAMADLTLQGNIVISVGLFGHETGLDMNSCTKKMLDKLHFQKIDLSDEIYVINPNGYIGLSTCDEIHYAIAHNKKVNYLVQPHPTITIGGVELPRPEVNAPKVGTEYYLWYPNVNSYSWVGDSIDHEWLKMDGLHLTEDRAQAWADWWENTVIKAVNK
jgi:hypothetical protein